MGLHQQRAVLAAQRVQLLQRQKVQPRMRQHHLRLRAQDQIVVVAVLQPRLQPEQHLQPQPFALGLHGLIALDPLPGLFRRRSRKAFHVFPVVVIRNDDARISCRRVHPGDLRRVHLAAMAAVGRVRMKLPFHPLFPPNCPARLVRSIFARRFSPRRRKAFDIIADGPLSVKAGQISCCSLMISLNCSPRRSAALRHSTMRLKKISK